MARRIGNLTSINIWIRQNIGATRFYSSTYQPGETKGGWCGRSYGIGKEYGPVISIEHVQDYTVAFLEANVCTGGDGGLWWDSYSRRGIR